MSGSLENHLWMHAKALRRLASCLVGESAADDLVQETALEALQVRGARPLALRSWLFAVLRNLASKHRRGRDRRQRHERLVPPPAASPTPDRLAEQREIVRRLDAALLELAEPYQGTLLLRFFAGLSPSEIAAQTGAPLASVKSRLQRGLALLRERLARDGAGDDWWRALCAFGLPEAGKAGAAVAATATTGVMLMGTGVKFAIGGAAAAIAVVATLCLQRGGPPQPGPLAAAAASAGAVPAAADLDAQVTDAARPQAAEESTNQREALAPARAAADPDDPADPALRIRVCDAGDRPVGDVPVGLRAGEGPGARIVWRQVTAPSDGIARVPMPRTLLQPTSGPVFATLLSPMRPVPAVALDRAALPTQPVRLVLPATGRVRVWIEDLAPAVAEQVTVTLGVAGDPSLAQEFMPEASAHPAAGAAEFPFVGLGLSLLVRAQRPGQNEETKLVVTGPVQAGEVVQVRLRVQPPPDRIVLVVHVVDPENRPFDRRPVEIALEARGGGASSSGQFPLESDSEGVLRLATHADFGTLPERSLRLRGKCGERQETCEAMVVLPPTFVPGENDVGTARLLPPVLVCGGTVVSQEGEPVADAELQVFVRRVDANGAPREPQQVRGLEGRSDHEGRFDLRGTSPTSDLCLGVAAPGCLPAMVPFLYGAADQRIVLDAAASVAGSVRLDDVVAAPDVLVELLGDHPEQKRLQVDGGLGRFVFASLAPGTATVKVHVVGDPDGLVVAGLPLRPGEVTRDDRLQEVDLSSGRRAVRFTVVDANGRPVTGARVAVLTGKDQRSFEGYMLTAGQGRVVTRADRLEVLAFAEGFRAVRVADLADGDKIVLPEPLSVRLRLPAGCPVAEPFALEVCLEAAGSTSPGRVSYRFFEGLNGEYSGDGDLLPWSGSEVAVCGPGGDALVRLPEPGTWAVRWRLSVHQPVDRTDRWIDNEPKTIEVRDVPGEQLVPAGLQPEQLAAARERLRHAH